MALRSSNPTLRSFNRYEYMTGATDPAKLMTISGTIDKSLILLALVLGGGVGGAYLTRTQPESVGIVMIGGILVGFVLALVTTFKQDLAPVLSPIYAVAEGLALGAISLMYESAFHGIVGNALLITVSILGLMLVLYRTGIVRATPNFVRGMIFSMGAIMIVYLADMVLRLFGHQVPFLNDSGPVGIIISLVICGVASFSFILDFSIIENGAQRGAPKYMEWYGAFSLLVTLVWLYLEVLRLLSKLQSSNR